jgi:hypothetical protein
MPDCRRMAFFQESRMAKRTSKPTAGGTKPGPAATESMEETIRRRAYELHLQRGDAQGSELDDWLRAEREVQAERQRK